MTSEANLTPGSPALIMPATWRDLRALRVVEKTCFGSESWPLLDLVGILTMPGILRLKAEVEGEFAGFIAADLKPTEKLAWIATFCVAPEHQRRGIGGALLKACEERLAVPRVRLSVRTTNQAAIRLYLGFGYQKVGLWKSYYQNGEDALVMEKSLQGKGNL